MTDFFGGSSGVGAAAQAAQAAATAAAESAAATAAKVTQIEAAPYLRGSRGRFTIATAVGVAATVDFPVVFDKALPTTDYNVVVGFEGSDTGVLGSLSAMVKPASKSMTGCTVSVKNSALISLGLNVTVTVIALY